MTQAIKHWENAVHFYRTLFLIALSYLLYQFFYNTYSILGVDDFGFAHAIYEYKNGLPYRDFPPYKTVMGNYLLLLPLLLAKGMISPLIYTKNALAIINAGAFLGAAVWMKRHFSKMAVLSSLILLISAEITLDNSTNIRADLLSYWLCLFSFLWVMENKFILGGLLLGLGFVVSQKVAWYLFASDCALVFYGLKYARNSRYLANIILFNAASLLVVLAYLVLWSSFSNMNTVLHSVFYEAYVMYKLDYYDSSRFFYWMGILRYNPLLFLLWPLILLSLILVPKNDQGYKLRSLILVYALAAFFCLIRHKQVFYYYMLTLLPAFLLLYAAWFSWLYAFFQKKAILKLKGRAKLKLWSLITLYSLSVLYVILIFKISLIYLLMLLTPTAIGVYASAPVYFKDKVRRQILFSLIILSLVFTGLVYPLCALIGHLPERNSAYQKAVLGLMDSLLQDGSDYVAGVELVYNKNQPIPGMRQLEIPAIDYLTSQDEKLRPFMSLASLYHTPDASVTSVIANLRKSRVKLYINNYRMHALPPTIQTYLNSVYEQYWGSLYLYAPQVAAGKQQVQIKFAGNYLIEGQSDILLDGRKYSALTKLNLTEGQHYSYSKQVYRLKLLPEIEHPAYQLDEWDRML